MVPSIRVVSAATLDHFNALECMVSTLHQTDPTVPVLVHSLDSHISARAARLQAANARVSVRLVDWSLMPSFARVRPHLREKRDESAKAGHYAWKPLLIAQAFERGEQEALIWLDAEHRLAHLNLLRRMAASAKALGGVLSMWSAGSMARWTHPHTLAYMYNASTSSATAAVLGPQRPPSVTLGATENCDASTLVLIRGHPRAAAVLRAWTACAQVEECIAPAGSSRANHRQDQAALTVILQATRCLPSRSTRLHPNPPHPTRNGLIYPTLSLPIPPHPITDPCHQLFARAPSHPTPPH